MASSILSDNGVTSGSAGLKTSADSTGVLALQTTTAGGTATTAVTITTGQYVGIGTTTPQNALVVSNGGAGGVEIDPSGYISSYNRSTSAQQDLYIRALQQYFYSNGVERMRIDSSGNVGIGVTPSSGTGWANNLEMLSTSNIINQGTDFSVGTNWYYNSGYKYKTTAAVTNIYQKSGTIQFQYAASGTAGSAFTFSESMRIDSSGNLLVGQTTGTNGRIIAKQTIADNVLYLNASNATTPYGLQIYYSAAAPNSTGSEFFYCNDTSAVRMSLRSNGGIVNYSANNVNLSDQREKKDITLAPNYLDKICQIPVKTFLFNDQTDTDLNLGAIAQDVQAVCPELVHESNWASRDEPEKMRLSIYQTDLQYALMKSIQELKAINDTQAETINALTARIVVLEAK